jgi:hypothetical protein
MAKPAGRRLSLIKPMELIHRYLTQALVEGVWGEVRIRERQRIWGLFEMAVFWTSIALHAPPSLRAALAEANEEGPSRFRAPRAVPQAFFARSKNLSWVFFATVFSRFRARLVAAAPRTFCAGLRPLFRRFPHVLALDGSKLDPVRRRLKIVWRDPRAVLPGMLVAFYDLATGTIAKLVFHPVAKASEFRAALGALGDLARGTLLVADRAYGVPKFFEALCARGLFGVSRVFSAVGVRRSRRWSKRSTPEGDVEDWEVVAGVRGTRLRLVRLLRGGRAKLEVFTNVLDPRRLSAQETLDLYRRRWTVERLFSDLKEVLNLRRFYGANVNSVGIQVFVTAIVHTVLRVSQAMVAQQALVEPEEISTKKFFPKAAAASACLSGSECTYFAMVKANRGVRLRKPSWHRMPYATTTLDAVRVEPRLSRKRRRRFRRHVTRPGESTWRSLPRARSRPPPCVK